MGDFSPYSLFLLFFISFTFNSLNFSYGDLGEAEWINVKDDDEYNMVQNGITSLKKCDLSSGIWVYDQSYPLYDSGCPYLSTRVSCQQNGRPDTDYEKWRWKPHGCSIPRFHALDFLAKMRMKRIVLVGDSIMRNQWESLVCLVEAVIPPERKMVTYNGPTMSFHALDFETSIEFSWAPFLVEIKEGSKKERILHLDSIEVNARFWRGADILVFDSAHWWTHSSKWSSWDYCMEGQSVLRNLNPMIAYEKGLTTWAKWIDLNLNPQRTQVIFRSISPQHNRETGWKCYNQRKPLGYFSHKLHVPEQLIVLQGVLRKMNFPVYLQDITRISAFRRDGHPSVYARALDEKDRLHHKDYTSDCSHWCLPGVPDIWNEMLNALL
ncbi:hypothetical protein IFM89_031432 [Coptis chinensis]|uniref:Trichome birefringence-like N-terminal domain-containing protein n=1 Tax=Coptis chinensis TaxID=261450 RepID=A0A835LPE9_9MAGN|nr:hypothetical protein IFM89_031432 [Coptis chinensis]